MHEFHNKKNWLHVKDKVKLESHLKCSSPSFISVRQYRSLRCRQFDSIHIIILPKKIPWIVVIFTSCLGQIFVSWRHQMSITENKTLSLLYVFKWFYFAIIVFHSPTNNVNEFIQISCIIPTHSPSQKEFGKNSLFAIYQCNSVSFWTHRSFRLLLSF